MTPCEVHIFDPTLSLGTQQQLRLVKEFNFHDTGLIAEGVKVSIAAPCVMRLLHLLRCPICKSPQQLSSSIHAKVEESWTLSRRLHMAGRRHVTDYKGANER